MDWHTVGQAQKWEKNVLVVCQKHDLMWTYCGLKAARWSFPGVAKCEFLFPLDAEWKEETLWTPYHFSSASQPNMPGSPKHRAAFSTGSCSALQPGTLLLPSLTARSSRNFALFAFQFSGLHKHETSHLFHRCGELQDHDGVSIPQMGGTAGPSWS